MKWEKEFPSTTTRWILKGDTNKAKEMINDGNRLLYQLLNKMTIGKVNQMAMERYFFVFGSDGSLVRATIRVTSAFGHNTVIVNVPSVEEVVEVSEAYPLVATFEGSTERVYFTWMTPTGGAAPYKHFYIDLSDIITTTSFAGRPSVIQPQEFYIPEDNATIGLLFLYDWPGSYLFRWSVVKYKVTTVKTDGVDVVMDGRTYVQYNREAAKTTVDFTGWAAGMAGMASIITPPSTMEFAEDFIWGTTQPGIGFWPTDSGQFSHGENWAVGMDPTTDGETVGTPTISGLNLTWNHSFHIDFDLTHAAWHALNPGSVVQTVNIVETDNVIGYTAEGNSTPEMPVAPIGWGNTYATLDWKYYFIGIATLHINRRHTMTVTPTPLIFSGTITDLDDFGETMDWELDTTAIWSTTVQHYYDGNPVPTTYDWTMDVGGEILAEVDSSGNWRMTDPAGVLGDASVITLSDFGDPGSSGNETGTGFACTGNPGTGAVQTVRAVYNNSTGTVTIPMVEWTDGVPGESPYTKKYEIPDLPRTIVGETFADPMPTTAEENPKAVQGYGKVDKTRIAFIDESADDELYYNGLIASNVYYKHDDTWPTPDVKCGREYWLAADKLGSTTPARAINSYDEWALNHIYFTCEGYENLGYGYGITNCEISPNNRNYHCGFGVYVPANATEFVPSK